MTDGLISQAIHNDDLPLQSLHDLKDRDGLRRSGKLVPSLCSSLGRDETCRAQRNDELPQVFFRDFFSLRDIPKEHKPPFVVREGKLYHEPESISGTG
jgi:hypothetical protein